MNNLKGMVGRLFSPNMYVNLILVILCVIILIGIFFPQSKLNAGVNVNAHLGGVSGNFSLETYDNEGQVGGINADDAPTVVFFKANWCGHCKRAFPEFEKAKKEYNGPLKLVVVDIDDNKQLAEKCGINGVPVCRYYKSFPPTSQALSDFIEYSGERTSQGFLDFMNKVQGVVPNSTHESAPVS